MANPSSTHLKLYTEHSPKVVRPPIEAIGSLPGVFRAFQEMTGWSLRYVPGPELKPPSEGIWTISITPGEGSPPGHLRLEPPNSKADAGGQRRAMDFETARALALAIAGMLDELQQTRHVLWQREAELAAGVPLIPHSDEESHLAEKLQTTLRGAAEAVDCQAAALYLIDEATTELKMRSCWGLPFERLMAPARQMKGELADLEALLGHAVVMENTAMMPGWKSPEDFTSAVCVPVASAAMLLGTLWVFGTEVHDFTDQQVHIIEIVAGKLAADLEREMLLREGVDGAQMKKQWTTAERLLRNQLPAISPMFDNWDISAWAAQGQELGGAFYDWFCLSDGLLAVTLGDAMDRGLEAAMSACAVKTAVRAHGQYHRQPEQTLQKVNLTLWTGSAGDQYADMFYGLIETAGGRVCFATAGKPSVVLLRQDEWKSLGHKSPPLGESPETDYEPFVCQLQPGEALAIFNEGFRMASDKQGRLLEESGLADLLSANIHLSADQLTSMARECLRLHAANPDQDDVAILIVKRTAS
ncbi:MAG: GAF domain-containing SpoIIE family protein phosphatase [Thermoguttaceae bacterium]